MPLFLTLALALAGTAQTSPSAENASPAVLVVGGYVLLAEFASAGRRSVRSVPFLTDAQGHAAPRSGWLNQPLKVVRETGTSYVLSKGAAQIWLPKRNLSAKAAFPLIRVQNSDPSLPALDRRVVSFNGQPLFPCEIVPGYRVAVTLKTARVESVWKIVGDDLNFAPQGGLVSGETAHSPLVSSAGVLVMVRPLTGVRALAAFLDASFQDRSPALMAQAPQRCSSLPGVYASADDVRRNLSTTPQPTRPPLPNDPDAAQRALIGWTRPQVLAQYGSPNEAGSLADLMKLGVWTFGYDYGFVSITFGPDGRVSQAQIARSP